MRWFAALRNFLYDSADRSFVHCLCCARALLDDGAAFNVAQLCLRKKVPVNMTRRVQSDTCQPHAAERHNFAGLQQARTQHKRSASARREETE